MNLRPQIPRPGGRLRVPDVIRHLYEDLRDRRLLPLVAVLLAVMVAAPIVLGGGGEEASPRPAPPSGAAHPPAARASFAVVPAEPGLRDYRRRLGDRRPRDPFADPRPAVAPHRARREGGARSSAPASAPADGAHAGPGNEAAPPVEPDPAGGATDGSVATPAPSKVVVRRRVLGYEIDVRAGFRGHVNDHLGIAPTTVLPNHRNPVVVYMGPTPDRRRALFLMTDGVTAYYGKAHCALRSDNCQLVALKAGTAATFAYGYGNARYKLILKQLVPVSRTERADAARR